MVLKFPAIRQIRSTENGCHPLWSSTFSVFFNQLDFAKSNAGEGSKGIYPKGGSIPASAPVAVSIGLIFQFKRRVIERIAGCPRDIRRQLHSSFKRQLGQQQI